jgi:hypothetical protein
MVKIVVYMGSIINNINNGCVSGGGVYSGDMYTELKLHCGVLNFEKLE